MRIKQIPQCVMLTRVSGLPPARMVSRSLSTTSASSSAVKRLGTSPLPNKQLMSSSISSSTICKRERWGKPIALQGGGYRCFLQHSQCSSAERACAQVGNDKYGKTGPAGFLDRSFYHYGYASRRKKLANPSARLSVFQHKYHILSLEASGKDSLFEAFLELLLPILVCYAYAYEYGTGHTGGQTSQRASATPCSSIPRYPRKSRERRQSHA